MTLTATPKLTGAETIYLDLNGQTVSQKDMNRLYNFDTKSTAKLILTDSSENGEGKVVSTGTRTGSNGGILDMPAGVTLELYRAALDASGLHVSGGNGTAISTRGTLVIHSGTIKGGSLDSGSKHGATLWVVDGAQVTMKDGLIVGGKAGRWGGAMYVNAAGTLFTMEGGRIEGGTADLLGGSVIIRANATFRMTGGTVTGGSAPEGANICVFGEEDTNKPGTYKNQGIFLMEGGTVTGGVYAPLGSGNVKITGSAVIDASLTDDPYTAPAYGLKVANGKTVDVTGLTGKVYVTAEPGKCFATGATAAMAETNVISQTKLDGTDLKVLFVEPGKLHMGAVYCVCGASLHGYPCQCDGKLQLWADWTDTTKLPAESSYWRLTDKVDVATVITLSTAEQICLDLNGQTVNLQNGENLYTFVKNAGAHVVVTDTSKDAKGRVVLTGSHSSNGGITEVLYGNTLETYRGTFDATDFTLANNGTVFAVRGTVVIHSGTYLGGTVDNGNHQKNGATFWLTDDGNMTILGGRVVGGYADSKAGAIYQASRSVLTIKGGTVTGGEAYSEGDNIHVNSADASFRMEGGTVTGGVYIGKAKEVTVKGGAVIDKELTDSAYTKPAYSLKLAAAYKADVTGLTGTVYVSGAADAVVATGATAAMAETNVISEVADLKVVLTAANELQLVAK